MRATYATLGSIVAFLAFAHLLWGDQPGLVRDFAPELATEVLGILITLVFVQRIIERRVRDDPFLAHVETLGEQLRIARELFPDEIEPEDYAINRTSAVRSDFMGTLSQAIRLYNEATLGDVPISKLPEGFWSPDRSPAPGTLRPGSPAPAPPPPSG